MNKRRKTIDDIGIGDKFIDDERGLLVSVKSFHGTTMMFCEASEGKEFDSYYHRSEENLRRINKYLKKNENGKITQII